MPIYFFLQDALDACKSEWDRVFVHQTYDTGSYRFEVVTGPLFNIFFSRYYNMLSRHYFEHLHVGRPCFCYFDLEFPRDKNPDFDYPQFWKDFRNLVKSMYAERFDEEIQDFQFYVLDSTTPEKLSKHILIRSQKLFPGNTTLKPIIDELCVKMQSLKIGQIVNARGQPDSIVDRGVYTKNRNFRMYLSTKFNKTAMLDYDKTWHKSMRAPDPYLLFCKSLVIPLDFPAFPLYDLSIFKKPPKNALPAPPAKASSPIQPSITANYKSLDDYILYAASFYSQNATIRKRTVYPKFVKYELSNYRYCYNIGDKHKSNNTYFLAYLEKGTLYQKCHNHECHKFYKKFPLPASVMKALPGAAA